MRQLMPATALIVVVLGTSCTRVSATMVTEEVINAIVARAQAIFSARINFILSTDNDGSTSNDQYQLSVSGHDWALRYPGSSSILMNTQDATLRFYETRSDAGKVSRGLHLTAAQSLDSAIGSNYAFAAARLGTLWYPQQIAFVERNRGRVQPGPAAEIQGMPTTLLQWPIASTDIGQAFVVVPNDIGTDFTGYLRVFAAPQLGYALPRIDYVSANGELLRRYESNDFIELEPGLFYPKVSRCISFSDQRAHTTRFDVSEIQYVNQDLPSGEFDVQVPADTRVRDSRPGAVPAAFRLDEQSDVENVREILDHDEHSQAVISFRIFCLAFNGLIASLLAFLWIRQRCRRNS